MADPAGESKSEAMRLDFDRRLMLRFHGSVITSDGGLLAYCELDDAALPCRGSGRPPAPTRPVGGAVNIGGREAAVGRERGGT